MSISSILEGLNEGRQNGNNLKKMGIFDNVSYVDYSKHIICTLDKAHYLDDRSWAN